SLFALELAEQLTVLSNIPRAAFMLVLVCWLLCIITRLISKLSTSLIIRWAWCVINVVRISLSFSWIDLLAVIRSIRIQIKDLAHIRGRLPGINAGAENSMHNLTSPFASFDFLMPAFLFP